ncbi:DUF4349 domain-containing protein [Rapidithrix thailandica]|uniref:DUF4349 domain-containing protein n=1 Tax=Rapidithrix thailandica TaxID=413964 RepID=A0AAW9S887_9BACT
MMIYKLLLIPCFMLWACNAQKAEYAGSLGHLAEVGADVASEQLAAPGADAVSVKQSRGAKLIKTADLRMQVKDMEATSGKLEVLTEQFDAYISSSSESNFGYEINQQIEIRVKAGNFDSLLQNIIGLGIYLDRKTVNVQDVTEQFIDLEARIKNKKAVEQSFLELMKKAKSVDEILKVQTELGNVRSEIESQEGRLKYLQDQVSYSTLRVELFQKVKGYEAAMPGLTFMEKVTGGFKTGWDTFLAIIVFLIEAWPFVLLLILTIFMLKWLFRKSGREKKAVQ